MKVYSTWKNTTYVFDFFIENIMDCEDEYSSNGAIVKTSIYTSEKQLLWSGHICVKFRNLEFIL